MAEIPMWLPQDSRILTLLLREGPLTVQEIASRLDMAYNRTWNVLMALLVDGCVVRCGRRRQYRFDWPQREAQR